MSTRKHSKKPYNERDDLEKILSQWDKLSGLHQRAEWSAVVVRAATAAEIAVNFAIRQEFEKRQSQLDAAFIDGLLRWANGLPNKLDKLLLPLLQEEAANHTTVKALRTHAEEISGKRNGVVHSGAFCDESTATKVKAECRTFILGIVHIFQQDFSLEASRPRKTRRQSSHAMEDT